MSLDTSLVTNSTPVQVEVLIAVLIGFMIVANTTVTDILFFDDYVLPDLAECHPQNQSEHCIDVRERHGLAIDAQNEIGNKYWNELVRQGIFIGFILFVIRMSFGWLLAREGIRKIQTSTILMAVFYGLVGAGIFFFGYVDTFYYIFQNEDIPEQLAHLNGVGIFSEAKGWTGDPDTVDREDLFLVNILGLVVLGAFAFVIMYVYANSGKKHRGIA